MLDKGIKEFYFSNGSEIFGPISYEEFCKNKYYKTTTVWYEGLNGWVSISEIQELKHLVGTFSTPKLDSIQPNTANTKAPPLDKRVQLPKTIKTNFFYVYIGVAIILIGIAAYLFTPNKNAPATNLLTLTADSLVKGLDTNNDSINVVLIKDVTTSAEKETIAKNWEKFIFVSPNDYRKKELGGIDNLKISVANNSPYSIDYAKVKVTYLKGNGDTAMHEYLEFQNIKANDTAELYAPDSKRGNKVVCTFVAVRSKVMNLNVKPKAIKL